MQNKTIIDYKYLEDLTDKIDFTHLAFAVYPKKEETVEEEDKKEEETIETDNKNFTFYKDETSSKDEETEEEEIKGYYLTIIQRVDNKIELGYYNKSKEWIKIYEITEDLTLNNLENLINKIKNNYYLKILQDINFEDNNKDYDFSIIELTNTTTSMNTNVANYKLIEYFKDGTFKEYSYILPTDYEEIKNKNDEILLSQE